MALLYDIFVNFDTIDVLDRSFFSRREGILLKL